jgi:phospholipid transport system substrate-binding protein
MMTSRFLKFLGAAIATSMLAAVPAFAAGAADLKVQTTKLLGQWTTKSGSSQLPPDVVDSFDYATFANEAIKPHASHLSATQMTKYKQVFEALLKKTVHRQAGSALADTKYTVAEPKINGDTATVDVTARMPKDDTTSNVVFTWHKTGDSWKIVDLAIDGGSLVRDYSNQFGRIIKRDGVDALISRLEKRLNGANEESARL